MNEQEANFVSLLKAFSTRAVLKELKIPSRMLDMHIKAEHLNILEAARCLKASGTKLDPEVNEMVELVSKAKDPGVLISLLSVHFFGNEEVTFLNWIKTLPGAKGIATPEKISEMLSGYHVGDAVDPLWKKSLEISEENFIKGIEILSLDGDSILSLEFYEEMKDYAIELITSEQRTTLSPRTVDMIKLILEALPLPDFKEKITAMRSEAIEESRLEAKERSEVDESVNESNDSDYSLSDDDLFIHSISPHKGPYTKPSEDLMEALLFSFLYHNSVKDPGDMDIYVYANKVKETIKRLKAEKGDRPFLCDLVKEALDCFLSIFVDEDGLDRQEVDMEEGLVYLRRLFKTTDRQDIVDFLNGDMSAADLSVTIQKAEKARLDRIVNNKSIADPNRKQYKHSTREETIMEKFDIKEHIKTSIAGRGLSLKPVRITDAPNHDVASSAKRTVVRIPLIDMSLFDSKEEREVQTTDLIMEDLFRSVYHGSLSMTMHPKGHWDKEKYLQNKVTELNLLLIKKLVESGIEHGAYLEEATKLTDFGNNFAIMYSYAIGLDQEWFVTDIVDRAWMAYCETHM